MELIIRNSSNQPIYDQIYCQIKSQILSGALAPGEAHASIRAQARISKSPSSPPSGPTRTGSPRIHLHHGGQGLLCGGTTTGDSAGTEARELETHLTAALELAKELRIDPTGSQANAWTFCPRRNRHECHCAQSHLQILRLVRHSGPDPGSPGRDDLRPGGRKRCGQITTIRL